MTGFLFIAGAIQPTASAADVTAPSVPTGLTAGAISGSQIDLMWETSTDNVAVTGYRVYRDTVLVDEVSGPVPGYSDLNLAQTTTYSYRVSAIDAANNESAQSTAASATTLDGTPPSVPTGLAVTVVSDDELSLDWANSTDNVAVTGYGIYRGGALVASSPTSNYNDTGLSPATTYSYEVSALDAAGNESGKSAPALATTDDAPASPVLMEDFQEFQPSTTGDPWPSFNITITADTDLILVKVANNTTHSYSVTVAGPTAPTPLVAGAVSGPADGVGTFVRVFYLVKTTAGSGWPAAGARAVSVNPSGVAGVGTVGVWTLKGATQGPPARNNANIVNPAASISVSLPTVQGGSFIASGQVNNGVQVTPSLAGGTLDHAVAGGSTNAGFGFGHSLPVAAGTVTHTWTQQNGRGAALMTEITGGGGGGPPPPDPPVVAFDKVVGDYAGYDSQNMNESEIPWFIPPATTGLTHLLYFSAMPKIISNVATIDPAHFQPPLNPSAVASSRTAAGSSATVLLVLGGAQTDVAFKNCMTYRVGTVNVTNNSANVVGVGTAWTSQLVGEIFSLTTTGIPYTVQSVTDGTHLVLTAPYAQPTLSGAAYEIEWTERRTQFIGNIVTYVAANAVFGGVDTDWEFPSASPQGAARFNTFHRELHAALVAEDPAYVLVTSSVGRYGPAYNANSVPMLKTLLDDDILEFVFVQFYAMAQAGFSQGNVWHHEALNHNQSDFGTPGFQVGVREAIQRYINAGWPAGKIVVGCQVGGIPWVGGNMDITNPGQGASEPCMRWTPTTTANRPSMPNELVYRQIIALTGGTFRRDVLSGNTPFWSKNVSGSADDQFLSYDDAISIADKVAFLGDGVGGGIAVWHLGSDFITSGSTPAQRHPVMFGLFSAVDDL